MVECKLSVTNVFLPSEHVCNWLVGAEGNQKSTTTNEQMFQQHHRAIQGQPIGHILFLSLSSSLETIFYTYEYIFIFLDLGGKL